ERLQFMCTLLEQALSGPADADLGWILELADSSITYRSRYMARPEWLPVLDLLVRDVHNPRSIYFQLKGLSDFVGRVYDAFGVAGAPGAEPQERMESAVRELENLDPGADLRHGGVRLLAQLRAWNQASGRLSEQLGLRFFSHSGEVNRQTFAT